jgi:fused signal recognition particle receptor
MRTPKKISLGRKLQGMFGKKPDEASIEEIEDILIGADFGIDFTEQIVDELGSARGGLMTELRSIIKRKMTPAQPTLDGSGDQEEGGLVVYLVFGVNGTGKTTSVAKLAHRFKQQGHRVLVAAADTYRDAAIEQLEVWSRRAGAGLIKQQQGSDAGAVVFDACDAAASRDIDRLVIDTAGRLHNKERLMQELAKLGSILDRKLPNHEKRKLLTIDATTGQNGISQAKLFGEAVGVHGIVLTKLDSSSKGGVACAISGLLGIPILYTGTGEGLEDLEPFSVDDYLDGLFAVN